MAVSALLVQPLPALTGRPTTFVLTVSNSGGSNVNVVSAQPTVTTPQGLPSMAYNLSQPISTVGQGLAQVGGSQFNVVVPAGGSVSFTFSVCFFGPLVNGGPTQPASVFMVGANVMTSDGSVFTPPVLQVDLNAPQFGQPAASPPNAAAVVSSLNFSTPANAALAL